MVIKLALIIEGEKATCQLQNREANSTELSLGIANLELIKGRFLESLKKLNQMGEQG